MPIHELSFQSLNLIPTLSFYNHRIALNSAIAPEQLESHLGKLAHQLSGETKMPVLAETTEVSLLSPYRLTSDGSVQILSVLAVDITAPRYRRQLKQMLNQRISDFFRSRCSRVDAYKREAFLEIVQISNEIEAQRFLTWHLRIDSNKYVFLVIDYGNEYHSSFTLDQRDLSTLLPEQPLVHTYDGKTCRYTGLAEFTVSEPIAGLGNISLLQYHRQKGEVSEQVLNAIPPETPAISVKYGSERPGNTFIAAHIPHLLKKTFTKDDVESTVFNAQVLSIDDRFKRSIEQIERLNNSGGIRIPGINLTFNTIPYRPEPQRNFAEQRQNQDYFGGGNFYSYPTQALKQRKVLEKPNQIDAIVFYPEQSKTKQIDFEKWCNRFNNFGKSFEINL